MSEKMTNQEQRELAQRMKRLAGDQAFQELISIVTQRQVKVFLSTSTGAQELEEAHDIVRAVNKIMGTLNGLIGNEAMVDHREKSAP